MLWRQIHAAGYRDWATSWFFAEYDAEGDASYSGSPDLCTQCHRSGDDFVRAFALP